MKTGNICKPSRATIATGLLAALVIIMAGNPALAWNFTVPAAPVTPQNGAFVFPAAGLQDGKARHFEYRHSPNQVVRFFVVKSTDGVIRAAFDACDVCFRAKKGYVQQGNDMICINCGLKFRTDKINEVSGGCNPGPLRRTMQGSNVIIAQQDVLAGLKYFQ